MEPRGAGAQEVVAQAGDDIEPESADRRPCRRRKPLELEPNPARDLRAAGIGKARELGRSGQSA